MEDILKTKLQKAIGKLKISKEEQTDLHSLIKAVPAPERSELIQALIEVPALIPKILANFRKKKEIAKKQNREGLIKIFQEEKKLLEEATKKPAEIS